MTYDEIKIREKGRPVAEEKVAEISKCIIRFADELDPSDQDPPEELIEILVDCFLAGYKEKENEMEEQR